MGLCIGTKLFIELYEVDLGRTNTAPGGAPGGRTIVADVGRKSGVPGAPGAPTGRNPGGN